jgi:hypothetical protein
VVTKGATYHIRAVGAFRAAHVGIAAVELACLGYIWFAALTRRRDRPLALAIGTLGTEGVGLLIGRGKCPLGPFQRRLGDPVPMFELFLPKRAAKLAVPVLVAVTGIGLVMVALRKPVKQQQPSIPETRVEQKARKLWAQRIAMVLDTATGIPLWAATPVVRRWHMRWGATDAEVAGEMPGDSIVPGANFNATRAITINAPPERVWPWIVQLGYGRAGFYTYDLVDNAGEPSANRVVEEYQHLAVGDRIPMFHESDDLAIAYKVDAFEKNEWMVWVHRPHENETPDSTWTWRLHRLPGDRTRLVTRMKQDYRWETPRLAIFNLVLMECGDFAMERRMLKGIKTRAEFD